jgi:peptidoglycan hydrolase CwlO-like protein
MPNDRFHRKINSLDDKILCLEVQINEVRKYLAESREEIASLKSNLDWNTKISLATLGSLLALIFGIVARVI